MEERHAAEKAELEHAFKKRRIKLSYKKNVGFYIYN